MKQKLFTLLLAVAASVGTMFASDTQVDGIWYDFDNSTKTASVTYHGRSYSSYSHEYLGKVVIPASVVYNAVTYAVTSIGYGAFYYCTGLTSVTIPTSVTSIGYSAFSICTGLTSVTIPNSVTSIGDYAFESCTGLTSPVYNAHVFAFMPTSYSGAYTIPDGIESIAGGAFYECTGLTSVTIPNSVTSIGYSAFCSCSSLTSVTIGNSVTSIGREAFLYCTALTSIYATCGDLERVKQLFNNDSRVKYAPLKYSITYNVNIREAGSVQIPENECGDVITAIPNYGYHFDKWSDGNTDNPRTITLTQDTAFVANFALNQYSIAVNCDKAYGRVEGETGQFDYKTQHTYTVIPNYGYHFTQWADGNTANPRTITLTQDTILTASFSKNSYTITLQSADPEQGSVSGSGTFEYLEQKQISATGNYGYHFDKWSDGNKDNPRTITLTQDTSLTAYFAVDKSGTCGKDNLLQWSFTEDGTLTISGNGELTENYTYGVEAPNQMQTLIIEKGVTAIGAQAFKGKTTLQKMVIGSNVTAIGNYAFADINNRQLTSLVMPAELRTIGDYAFSGNTYVESIDFNAKLQNIGAYAFKDCYRVSEMTCLAVVTPNVGTNALSSINENATLCVPAECLKKYKVDPNWGRFDLCELGSTATTTDTKVVTVEPTDNTALFIWPTENNAGAYTLKISKDGVIFCTLIFNGNGQLTGIAFAPSRDEDAHAPAATTSVAGMSFTVTGLNSASKYAYHLTVADENDKKIQAYSGEFATTGYQGAVNPGGQPEVTPQGIDQTTIEKTPTVTKFIRDGQLLIERDGKTYTVQGQEVK